MDWRNEGDVPLAKLRPTKDLRKRLPLKNVSVEPKLDGQRYTLEIDDALNYLISRSKYGKTKGVEASAGNQYVSRKLEEWMVGVKLPLKAVIDGELCATGNSTSSGVTRKDTEKVFIVFDILFADRDIRKFPYRDRRDILHSVVEKIGSPHIESVPCVDYDVFTEKDLRDCLDYIVKEGIEGFVVKELDRDYDRNWYGWKIKPEDNDDGFSLSVTEEKDHHLGTVTRTGRTGTMGVYQYASSGEPTLVAWVAIPEDERVSLDEKDQFIDRIVEFKHSGWNNVDNLFRFPQFVKWRDGDKPKEDCLFRFEV